MSQWGFFFNQDRCVGCKTCMVACKNWNEERRGDAKITVTTAVMNNFNAPEEGSGDYIAAVGDMEPGVHVDSTGANNYTLYRKYYMKENWRRLTTIEEGVTTERNGIFSCDAERRYLSVSCNHCDDPACLKACPTCNITKAEDTGIVSVGRNCISCGRCREACPWGAPQFYDPDFARYAINDLRRPCMTKCNLCIDRINEGKKPACVAACWNRALDAGPIDDLKSKYTSSPFNYILTDTLTDDFTNLSTKPNILFKGKAIKQS